MTPGIFAPDVIRDELLYIIRRQITQAPRSLQRRIGPSEFGMECTRRLVHKLAGHEEPQQVPKWLATVGTAVHAWLAETIAGCAEQQATIQPRFLVEHRVSVGELGGEAITGSVDLFDIDAGLVVDWKIVGTTRLALYKSKGPGQQYRSQVHLYARGMARAGHHVNGVMIAFLPRNEDLSRAFFWSEKYDEQIAIAAIARVESLRTAIGAFGPDPVLAMFPPCTDSFCPWCTAARRDTTPPANLAALIEIERQS